VEVAMDGTYKKTVTPPPLPMRAVPPPPVSGASLSTPQLVKEMVSEVKELSQKQIELAVAEARAELRREAFAAADLAIGAVGATITLTLLFVTVALALGSVVRPWGAGLIVTGIVLTATAGVTYVGWRRRVKTPLLRTRRGLRQDAKLVKEGGAA
jgi:hypothetical protein